MSQQITDLEEKASAAILEAIIASPHSSQLCDSYRVLVSAIGTRMFHAEHPVGGSNCTGVTSETPPPAPVSEQAASPDKAEPKKRGRKPQTTEETPAAPEPEAEAEEAQPEEPETDPNVDEAPAGKTHEEWIEQGKTLYLKKSGIAKDTSDEASRNFKANAAKLISKHGGTKVSDVPLENYEAFFAELVNLKL